MKRDTLVDEVRAIRESYARRFHYDLDAIYRDLKEKEKKAGHRVVSRHPRPLQTVPQKS